MKNHFSKNKTIDYFSVMSKIVDYIIESKNVHVVLIPHVIAPYDWGNDDIYAIQEVRKLVINKRKTLIIDNDLDAKELKGIIGQCDLFIGCRMHANIAALSQNIPTVAIGWSHKYYGIMKRLNMEEYVCDLKDLNFRILKDKIDKLFSKKEQIHEKLKIKTRNEFNSAFDAIKSVSGFLLSN
jgi:polysaccharide pyruvyl transferase WcaK-like protein